MNENKLEGGVIIIGSLYWEDETNCIAGDEVKGRLRRTWRENNLDISKKKLIKLPTRYGRASGSRKDTYSMILSSEYNNVKLQGIGLAIPFSKENMDYAEFRQQAISLAEAEGIINADYPLRLVASWGAIAVWVNDKSNFKNEINLWWETLMSEKKLGFNKSVDNFSWTDGHLLTEDYKLNLPISDCGLDFAFCTYIKPHHLDDRKNIQWQWDYPSPQEITTAMVNNNYQTYFRNNIKSNIHTADDKQIISLLPK